VLGSLRLLLVEDSVEDAELIELTLRGAGWRVATRRVEDAAGLRAALREPCDLIISDHTLPAFDAVAALELVRATNLDTPFIVVSGTIAQEVAIQMMGLGAADYVLKDDLRRLPAAIGRELTEAARRREHRRVREQLAAAERLATVGTLTTGLLHELKNPLSILIPNLKFVADELKLLTGPTRALEALGSALAEAIEASEHMRALAGDVRLLSPASDGRAPQEPVALAEVLDAAARLGGFELRRRCQVIRDYAPVPRVRADRAALAQVFLNLILNAAHALPRRAPADNRIVLRVRSGELGEVIAEVEDNGAGMEPEVQARIFDPFFTTKGDQGTGMGLAISRRIVDEHGGRIDVKSAPGRGTTMSVVLAAMREPPPRPAPARRARVLVIDDNQAIRTVMRNILAEWHDVETATSVADAMRRLNTGIAVDVIICDVTMPGLSGLDLQAYLEVRHPELAERTCFVSGLVGTPREAELLARVPRDRLVGKPFTPEELLAAIAALAPSSS